MPELNLHPDVPPPGGTSNPSGKSVLEAHSCVLSNSHHFISNLYPKDFYPQSIYVAEPNLHGLVETEVFVGGDEENFALEEHYHKNNIVPSSLVINYQKDGFLQSLNSVKEEIEAEAAEEQTLDGNYHSLDYLGLYLGHSSLSSSVISSTSIDEPMNTERDIRDLVLNKIECNHPLLYCKKSRSNKGTFNADKLSFKPVKCNGITLSPIPSRCSPKPVKASPSTHSISNCSSNVLLKEEYHCDRNGCKGTPQKAFYLIAERNKHCFTKKSSKGPIWHNPSKSDKFLNTNAKKDNCTTVSNLKREGSGRAKSETRESNGNNENKYSSLPRKKKEKSEKDIVAETYGTLSRNRRLIVNAVPAPNAKINICKELPTESKNILDKYATLPRRKAKEISARWQDQSVSKVIKDAPPMLQRSKSAGKGESFRSTKVSPSNSVCLSSSIAQSPRLSNNSTKLKIKPSSSPSAKIIVRQGSVAKEKPDKSPSPGIYGGSKHPKLSRIIKKNAEIQVNIKWDPDENELADKLRKLSEEFNILQKKLINAERTADEVEQLRMEAVDLRSTAESERMEKEELQEELDKTSEKVREMLTSMEGVEKEFNNRGESLIVFESQLQNSTDININMQERLNQYEEHAIKMQKDLEKSLAAQKILLQQVQDLEAEGREMVEFMAEEKNALSECLKEAEMESNRKTKEVDLLTCKLMQKDEEARHMVRLAEERRLGYLSLQTEMKSLQLNAQDLMVCQGADVTGASVGLENLALRLQILTSRLVQDYSISENDIDNVVTPVDSDSSISSANGTPELQKSPIRAVNRSASPRKPVSFMQSFLNAMRCAQNASKLLSSSLKPTGIKLLDTDTVLIKSVEETRNSLIVDNSVKQSLADQVTEIDNLVTRFLKVCCVLKCDADNILSELEDENERLCSQIQLQQQMIDQQYVDFESLTTFELNARKELKLITKDLEIAKETLNKVCDDDSKLQVKKFEDELDKISLTLHHLEKLHVEQHNIMNCARLHLADLSQPICDSHRSGNFPYLPSGKALRHVSKHIAKICPCKQSFLIVNGQSSENIHCLDYSKYFNGNSSTSSDAQGNDRTDEKQHEIDLLVNLVLKTLETVPDVVSSSPTLKNLYVQLNTSVSFEQTYGNPSCGNTSMASTSTISNLENHLLSNDLSLNLGSDSSAGTIKTMTPSVSLANEVAIEGHSSLEVEIGNDEKIDRLSIIDRYSEKTSSINIDLSHSKVENENGRTAAYDQNNESSVTAFLEDVETLTYNSSELLEKPKLAETDHSDDTCNMKSSCQSLHNKSLNNETVSNNNHDAAGDAMIFGSYNLPSPYANVNENNEGQVHFVSVSTNNMTTCTVATNTEESDLFSKKEERLSVSDISNENNDDIVFTIDCNANPEITIASTSTTDSVSQLSDINKLIPLLTHETSL